MKKIILIFSIFVGFSLTACDSVSTDVVNTTISTTTSIEFDKSMNIQIYTRDTTSGTREAFFKGIGFDDAIEDNQFLAEGFVEVNGNGSMISSIVGDEYGIGYISLSSLEESGLIGLEYDGIIPTEANVLNDSYGLKRPFMYIVRDDWTEMETEHQIIEAFLAYMSSVDGKATIKNKSGILSIDSTDSLWDDIKSNYDVCSLDNSGVTIQFGGSTSVEVVARALSEEFSPKCGNFIAEHNHTGSGDAYIRTQGSEANGANKLHIAFASRNFKDTEVVASNTYGQLCWDAVVIVINGTNNVLTTINEEDLKKIYTGEITTWGELV